MTTRIDNGAGAGGWSRWRVAGWGFAAFLLLLPLVAMRFTAEVNWDAADFVAIGAMLAVAGAGIELAARISGDRYYRAGAAMAVATGFLLIWVNLAVGMLGGEANPANLLFAGVIGVGVVGAVAGRFRAAGMVRAMTAAAVAQALVGVAAPLFGLGSAGAAGVYEAVLATVPFGGLWLGSAWLFRRAAVRPVRG